MLSNIFKKNRTYITANVPRVTGGHTCPKCYRSYSASQMEQNVYVCQNCGYHFSIDSHKRIELLVDENSFLELHSNMISSNPLSFPGYEEKVKSDQEKTNINEAVVTGMAKINGYPFVIGVMDSRFRMGSMGSVVGHKITLAIEKAIEEKSPFILFSASGGARMQEGVLSLMQMAKTSAALQKLDEAGLLFISIMTHPTTGGVSASFASLGDINIAEPGATIGFAGRRIIEQTIREELPKEFQTAEFLLECGQLDKVVDRREMKQFFSEMFMMHGGSQNAGTND